MRKVVLGFLVCLFLGCGNKDPVGEQSSESLESFIWKFDTTWEASKPIIYENRLYASAGNYLYVLDAATGKEVWRHGELYASHSAPALYDQRVYIGSNKGQPPMTKVTGLSLLFPSPSSASTALYRRHLDAA